MSVCLWSSWGQGCQVSSEITSLRSLNEKLKSPSRPPSCSAFYHDPSKLSDFTVGKIKAEELRIVDVLWRGWAKKKPQTTGGIAPNSTPSESATENQCEGIKWTEIEREKRLLKSVISPQIPDNDWPVLTKSTRSYTERTFLVNTDLCVCIQHWWNLCARNE